jgi:hypothetical protein
MLFDFTTKIAQLSLQIRRQEWLSLCRNVSPENLQKVAQFAPE